MKVKARVFLEPRRRWSMEFDMLAILMDTIYGFGEEDESAKRKVKRLNHGD